ncbi:MAG: hypothetical protein ACOX6D_09965 [Thermoguttaceae bacterium]|jgi:O-antigen/teichoic acid export membrane protein
MVIRLLSKYKNLDANSRIVVSNVTCSFLIKGIALCISYLMLPTYIRFFKQDTVLGLWFTILSVLLLIFHFNLGIGNGLRNHLSKALAVEDYKSAKKYVSSAYFFIGLLSLLLTIVALVVTHYSNLNKVFHVTPDVVSSDTLKLTVRIVLIGLMIHFFLGVINYILFAMQCSFALGLISLFSSLFMLTGVLVCPSGTNEHNLINMAFIHVFALNVPLLIATLIVFGWKLRFAIPSIKEISWKYGKSLLKLGGLFFYVQIVFLVIMGSNEYLISFFTDNENVVEYQIYHKLFLLAGTIFTISLGPVWSVVTKALAENKTDWVHSLYKKLNFLAFLALLFEFVIILFLQCIVDFWLKENTIKINYFYSIIFAIFGSLLIYNMVLASFANGIGILRTQSAVYTVGAALKVPLTMLLIKMTGSWIGVILATDILLLIYCVVQPITLRTYFGKR